MNLLSTDNWWESSPALWSQSEGRPEGDLDRNDILARYEKAYDSIRDDYHE